MDDISLNSVSIEYLMMGWYRIVSSKLFKQNFPHVFTEHFSYFQKILRQFYQECIMQINYIKYGSQPYQDPSSQIFVFQSNEQFFTNAISDYLDSFQYAVFIMIGVIRYSNVEMLNSVKSLMDLQLQVVQLLLKE